MKISVESLSSLFYFPYIIRGKLLRVSNNEEIQFYISATNSFGKLKFTPNSKEKSNDRDDFFYLAISGDDILSKKINDEQLDTNVESIFPGIKLIDFYYQLFKHNNIQWLSIVRKDRLKTLIANTPNENYHSIVLVPEDFYGLATLNEKDKEKNFLETDNSDLNKENSRILLELVTEEMISNKLPTIFPLLNEVDTNCKKLHFRFNAKRIVVFFLMALIIILFINSYLYSKLYSSNSLLNSKSMALNLIKREIDSLRIIANNNDRILDQLKISDQQSAAYFIDRIASTIPKSITLCKIQVYDIYKESYSDSLKINRNTIHVEGIAGNKEFGIWIQKLKVTSFCKDISINFFQPLNPYNNSNFSITIILHEQ